LAASADGAGRGDSAARIFILGSWLGRMDSGGSMFLAQPNAAIIGVNLNEAAHHLRKCEAFHTFSRWIVLMRFIKFVPFLLGMSFVDF